MLCVACTSPVNRNKAPIADTPQKLMMGELLPIPMANGLHFYLVRLANYPKFTLSINIDLPHINQDPEQVARKVLTNAYSKKRSLTFTNGEIESLPKQLGAMLALNIYGGVIKGMKRNVNQLLELYTDGLFNPLINNENISEVVKKHQQSLAKKAQKIKQFKTPHIKKPLMDNLKNSLLKSSQYDDITVVDVKQYFRNNIVANNATVVLVGDFTQAEAKQLSDKYFGYWQQGELLKPQVNQLIKQSVTKQPAVKHRKLVVIDNPTAVQSTISFKWLLNDAFKFFNKTLELNLLNEVFGGSQSSYLYKNLREEKALCYNISSSLGESTIGGIGTINTHVQTDKTEYAIENIIFEMLRIRNTLVSKSDLFKAKNSLIGKHTRSLSAVNHSPYITFAMSKRQYNLPNDYLQTKPSQYYQINQQTIQFMAQQYIKPYEQVITVTGNVKELRGKLERFGEVVYLDSSNNPL